MFYHGSRAFLPPGTILRPRGEDYERDWERTDFYVILEHYRPTHRTPHKNSVFLVADPDDVDVAGGATDWLLKVLPVGEVSQHDLNWSSEISVLVNQGHVIGDPEIRDAALAYWQGLPHYNESVWEFLAPEAQVIQAEPF